MKPTSSPGAGGFSRLAGRVSFGLPAMLALALAVWLPAASAQEAGGDPRGEEGEVMTRGPVHEAFAGVISYNAEPGMVVSKAPPELIEEIPPEERPEGDNVTWIPGYWAWDDERDDFLWVSGIWRDLPPGREWIAGYWAGVEEGYQWTCGYWADAGVQETTYLPEPPPTVEEGPNIAAPSEDHCWTPGNWVWRGDRYAWSAGYWAEGQDDWDWIPAHYVWTARGHVFVDGYWDYPVRRRGLVFAPVHFHAGVYSRPGFSYSPSVMIGWELITNHLFIRPRHDHYYFGDYYAREYTDRGYHTAFSYQSERRGYDPIYAWQRWEHRRDRDWENRFRQEYERRREDERARPPRTWADLGKWLPEGGGDGRGKKDRLAAVFRDYTKRQEGGNRFLPVAAGDRERFGLLGGAMKKARDDRRDVEMRGGGGGRDKKDRKKEVSREKAARSPIAFKNAGDGKGGKPPEPRRGPKGGEKGDKGGPQDSKGGNPRGPDGVSPQPDERKPGKGSAKNDARKQDKGSPRKDSDSRKPDNGPPSKKPDKADKPKKDSPTGKEGNPGKKTAPSSPRPPTGNSKKSKPSDARPKSGKPEAGKNKPSSKSKPQQAHSKPSSQPKPGKGGGEGNQKDSKGGGRGKDKK